MPFDQVNPRFAAYARSHDRTPDEQMAHDVEAFPGGKMAGFVAWIDQRWSAWRALVGKRRDDILSGDDHAAFDAWLAGTGDL